MNVPPTFARTAGEGVHLRPVWLEEAVEEIARRHRPAHGSLRVLAAGGSTCAEAYLEARALVVLAESAAFDRRAHAHRRVATTGLPAPHRRGEADLILLPDLVMLDVSGLADAVAQALAPGGVCVVAVDVETRASVIRAFDRARLDIVEQAAFDQGISILVAKDPRPQQPHHLQAPDLDRSTCIDRQRVVDALTTPPWLGPALTSSGSLPALLQALAHQLETGEPDPTTLPWPAPQRRANGAPSPGCEVLAVMPHPDDESIYVGGTLAGLSAGGERVRLLTVTDGAGGRGGDGLSARRRAELSAAAAVLGIKEVRVLEWEDFGKYRDDARTQPVTSRDALRVWGLEESLTELVAEIRRSRPRRVLGLHPDVDPNVSLHGHHLGLGLLLALAFHAAADSTFAPQAGEAWAVEEHRVVMSPCHAAWAQPFEIDRAIKIRALEAHQSQSYSTTRLIESLANPTKAAVEYTRVLQGHSQEPWVLIRRRPGPGIGRDIDWKAEAAHVNEFPRPREALVDLLRQQAGPERSEAVEKSLACLQREDGVAVLTGQQVGLLGGPVYTLAKALSAVALARQLTRQGIEAAPVFWLASQDHDLDEVQRVARLDAPDLDLGLPDDGAPVGRRRLGPKAEQLWERFVSELPPGSDLSAVEELRSAMNSGQSFGSSFKAVLRRATRETGLLILDPDDPQFAQLAAPLLRRAMTEDPAVRDALRRARSRVEAQGGREVVSTEREVSQLFFVGADGRRRRLGDSELASSELEEAMVREPQRFSAAALLRPLVQDFVLPTVAIVAGPTESRYLDQTRELYDWAGVPRPKILRRASFLPVASTDARALLPAGGVTTLRRSPHPLADIGKAALPRSAATWFEAIERLIAWLGEPDVQVAQSALEEALEPPSEALTQLPRLSKSWPRWALVLEKRSQALLVETMPQRRSRARGRLRGELLRLRRSMLRDGRKLATPALEAWGRAGSHPASPERRMSVVELLARGGSTLPSRLLAAMEPELSPEFEIWIGGDA